MPQITLTVEVPMEVTFEYQIDPPEPDVGIFGPTLREAYIVDIDGVGLVAENFDVTKLEEKILKFYEDQILEAGEE
jgi:hypothetical protein